MRVEQIEVGKTYEGKEEGRKRIVTRLWPSLSRTMQVEYFDLCERMEWNTALSNFLRWAVREVPHA